LSDFFGKVIFHNDVEIRGDLNIKGSITMTATAAEDIKAGTAVYVSESGKVKTVDVTNKDITEVLGIAAKDAKKDEEVTVIIGGKVKGLKDLQAGKKYYVGDKAEITKDLPDDAVNSIPVGIAFSDTELVIQLGQSKPVPPKTSVTPTPSDTKTITIRDNELGFLRVRKEPSSTSDEVGQVDPGKTFEIIDDKDTGTTIWFKIEYSSGEYGWVSGSYVTIN
jgi:uncharacterized protein YgiM (DUF1202 family)